MSPADSAKQPRGRSGERTRSRPRVSTRALTIANVAVLIVSAMAFAVARLQSPDLPSLIHPLAWAFPTVAALVEAPVIWVWVLFIAIVIAAGSTPPDPARPWWPRFYRKLSWCGLATVPVAWAFTGTILVWGQIAGMS